MKTPMIENPGFAGRIAAAFVNSRLTPLALVLSLLLGFFAITMLPREEEPQIKVPMIDVLVSMPGATPAEIEQRVSIPMEKLLYELPGVEYIYSTSMSGQSMLVVRFYVGEDLETAIVRLNQKLATNFDRIPHGVSPGQGIGKRRPGGLRATRTRPGRGHPESCASWGSVGPERGV